MMVSRRCTLGKWDFLEAMVDRAQHSIRHELQRQGFYVNTVHSTRRLTCCLAWRPWPLLPHMLPPPIGARSFCSDKWRDSHSRSRVLSHGHVIKRMMEEKMHPDSQPLPGYATHVDDSSNLPGQQATGSLAPFSPYPLAVPIANSHSRHPKPWVPRHERTSVENWSMCDTVHAWLHEVHTYFFLPSGELVEHWNMFKCATAAFVWLRRGLLWRETGSDARPQDVHAVGDLIFRLCAMSHKWDSISEHRDVTFFVCSVHSLIVRPTPSHLEVRAPLPVRFIGPMHGTDACTAKSAGCVTKLQKLTLILHGHQCAALRASLVCGRGLYTTCSTLYDTIVIVIVISSITIVIIIITCMYVCE
jgi:hypothetical protein